MGSTRTQLKKKKKDFSGKKEKNNPWMKKKLRWKKGKEKDPIKKKGLEWKINK
jgi:hypothetical protein